MADKQLILTADDFGRSAAVNAEIIRWHRAGAITHTGLMVNEPHAVEAVAFARENPGLQAGLHLALCDGLDATGNPLPRSPAWAGLRFAFSPAARAWLRIEIAAQFARFAETALPRWQWDGHAHLHLHPVVMRIALPIAVHHGFRFTRLVREPGPPALLPWIFNRLSESTTRSLRAAGVGFADRVFGLRATGKMTANEFERAISNTGPGVTEIYCHPGAEAAPPEPEWIAQRLRQ